MKKLALLLLVLAATLSGCSRIQAPTEMPKVDRAFQAAAEYSFGDSREPLMAVKDQIRASYGDPAERRYVLMKMVDFLDSDASFEARQFMCKQLAIVGTADEVPALADLLSDPETADMGRYALERIAAPEAERALLDALEKTDGAVRVGVINSLGARRDPAAVDAIAPYLKSTDADTMNSAAVALGRIDTDESASILSEAFKSAQGDKKAMLAHACLECAENLVFGGKNEQAANVYRMIYDNADAKQIRVAGLSGLVMLAEPQSVELVLNELQGDDMKMQTLASRFVSEIPGEETTKAFAAKLPDLQPSAQVVLVRALGDRGDPAAESAVLKLAESDQAEVRAAAIEALGSVGDSQSVPTLVQALASENENVRNMAGRSLRQVQGDGVNKAILSEMEGLSPEAKVSTIEVLSARGATEAVQPLMELASSAPEEKVQMAALEALGSLANADDMPALTNLLTVVKSDSLREQAESALVAAARRIPADKSPSAALQAKYTEAENAAVKESLLVAMGEIGDPSSLDTLRSAIKSDQPALREAAIRALSQWPTAEPADLLAEAAAGASDETQRVLALRGYVGLITRPSERSTDETLAMLKNAMKIAQRPEEQKTVLGAVGELPSVEAAQYAASFAEKPELSAEARAAAVKAASGVWQERPEAVEQIVKPIAESAEVDSVKNNAESVLSNVRKLRSFIVDWDVCGPFTQKDADFQALHDIAFAPEKPDEQADWNQIEDLPTRGSPWVIDLNAVEGVGGGNRAAYVRTQVWSPEARKAQLAVGSDDGFKAWWNGELVNQNNESHALSADAYKANVEVKEGWNTLMLKVTNGGGEYEFAARLMTPEGEPITDLKVDPQGASK